MTLQMVRNFPDNMSKTYQDAPTGFPGHYMKPTLVQMIEHMRSKASVIPDERLQVCQAVGLFVLKQEYRQMLPDLQASISPNVMKSFNNALSCMDSIFCDSLKETSEPTMLPMFPDDHVKVKRLLHNNFLGITRIFLKILKELPLQSSLRE